jgi:hypothetical protein
MGRSPLYSGVEHNCLRIDNNLTRASSLPIENNIGAERSCLSVDNN